MANFTSTHTGAVIDAAVTKITATSSSATELNLLDGVTATTAEINILDGVTSTAAEINILDGVTSTTAEINLLDGVTATTTELNLIDGVTATTAEINYIDGVTSNIQTQLNLKAPLAGASLTGTTSFQSLSDGTITITAFADEDDFSSNSATLLATQQSIKAYVDANVNTELIQDLVGAMFTSNTESGITVAYQDGDGTIDLTVATQSDNNFTTTLKNKLDAIEASATADQSNAEIRTAVEAATDSNVFTDADHSKLNAIEASATADQSNAEIVAAVEAGTDSNTFTDADHSKLNAIEANATADQTDEEIQDIVGAMFTSTNTETGITATYQDATGDIDLVVGTLNQDTTGNADTATKIASITNSDIVQLTSSQTLTNKTLTSPVLNTGVSGSAVLDEDNMASNSATKLSSQQSIKAYVDAEVAGVVDSSPAALNTLNELAAALGDDANFSTTTSTSLGNRLRVDTASQGLTGTQQANAITNLGITSTKAELNILDGVTATATELNLIDGVTATTAELNYVDGVTSNIQTQLDATPDTGGTGLTLSGTTFNVDVAQTQITSVGTLTALQVDNVNIDGSTLTNSSGDLSIINNTDDGDIILQSDDGAGGTTSYLTLDGGLGYMTAQKHMNFIDNQHVVLGTGNDLRFYHDSGDSINYIESSTSDMDIKIKVNDGGSTITALQIDASAVGSVLLPNDNQYLKIGAGNDLTMYHHSGGYSLIENTTGDLYITASDDDGDIILRSDDGSGGVTPYIILDGGSTFISLFQNTGIAATKKLYFDGGSDTYIQEDSADRLRFFVGGDEFMRFTESTGNSFSIYEDVYIPDDKKIHIGTGNDLKLYHDQSNTWIEQAGTGNLINFVSTQDADWYVKVNDGGSTINAIQIDASAVGRVILPNDNQKLTIGADYDLNFYNNGSVSYISNSNNTFNIDQSAAATMQIRNLSSDQDITFSVNDGGSQITALQIDASEVGQVKLPNDNQRLSLGASDDLDFIHDGSNSIIGNATGDLTIKNFAQDKDIIFMSDDGSGGETAYITLDGSISKTTLSKDLRAVDNVKITAGNADDLKLQHDGSNSYIQASGTGNLHIQQNTADQDLLLQCDDGSGGTTTYIRLDGSDTTIDIEKQMEFQDSVKLLLGTASDLEIYHDGSNSYIIGDGTGNLIISQQTDDADIILKSDNGSGGTTAYLTLDGSASTINVAKNIVSNNNVGFHQKDAAGNTAIIANLDTGDALRIGDTTHVEQIAISTAQTTNAMIFTTSGTISMSGNVTMSSPLSINYGLTVNEGGNDSDTRIEGDTDANLVRVDAGNDRVGIGTGSPAHKLDVVGTAGLSTGTAWTNTSDERIKTNVENIENGLDKILKLKPVSFNYTEDYLKANPELSSSKRYNSFIAQEYEEVFPDAVTSEKELVVDDKVIYDDLKQFTPHDLNMYLVKAIQEMKCEIDELKLKIGE